MELAREMGRVDWRQMLREMTPQELAEWLVFNRVRPFGNYRHTMSAVGAGICNQITLIGSALSGKQPDLLKEDAFLPQFNVDDETPDTIAALEQLTGLPT